jgi:hypothetical protein
VTPDEVGGAVARIEAQDESEEQASKHAEWLERRINSATSPQGLAAAAAEFLYGGSKFVDSVKFDAEGTRIHGTITVTARQLNIILTMVEGIINSWNPKPKAEPASSASANPSALPAGSAPPASSALPIRPSASPGSIGTPLPQPGAAPSPSAFVPRVPNQ